MAVEGTTPSDSSGADDYDSGRNAFSSFASFIPQPLTVASVSAHLPAHHGLIGRWQDQQNQLAPHVEADQLNQLTQQVRPVSQLQPPCLNQPYFQHQLFDQQNYWYYWTLHNQLHLPEPFEPRRQFGEQLPDSLHSDTHHQQNTKSEQLPFQGPELQPLSLPDPSLQLPHKQTPPPTTSAATFFALITTRKILSAHLAHDLFTSRDRYLPVRGDSVSLFSHHDPANAQYVLTVVNGPVVDGEVNGEEEYLAFALAPPEQGHSLGKASCMAFKLLRVQPRGKGKGKAKAKDGNISRDLYTIAPPEEDFQMGDRAGAKKGGKRAGRSGEKNGKRTNDNGSEGSQGEEENRPHGHFEDHVRAAFARDFQDLAMKMGGYYIVVDSGEAGVESGHGLGVSGPSGSAASTSSVGLNTLAGTDSDVVSASQTLGQISRALVPVSDVGLNLDGEIPSLLPQGHTYNYQHLPERFPQYFAMDIGVTNIPSMQPHLSHYRPHSGTVDSFDPGFFGNGEYNFPPTNQIAMPAPVVDNTAATGGTQGPPYGPSYVPDGANTHTQDANPIERFTYAPFGSLHGSSSSFPFNSQIDHSQGRSHSSLDRAGQCDASGTFATVQNSVLYKRGTQSNKRFQGTNYVQLGEHQASGDIGSISLAPGSRRSELITRPLRGMSRKGNENKGRKSAYDPYPDATKRAQMGVGANLAQKPPPAGQLLPINNVNSAYGDFDFGALCDPASSSTISPHDGHAVLANVNPQYYHAQLPANQDLEGYLSVEPLQQIPDVGAGLHQRTYHDATNDAPAGVDNGSFYSHLTNTFP